ncbi:MAG TPA: ribosomal-processing cysteine protease Prp [Syntrophomonadaceae bacterium]|nr:ribosomal-processing cysteine protease Prp [Syntrophomonadaceae bacterium]
MIEINITCTNGLITEFKVKGHAGFAAEGQDIYCAGVSAITQTALLGLMQHLEKEPVYSVKKGFLTCSLPQKLTENEMSRAQIILSTMETGLMSLQDAYPDYVKVTRGGVYDV